MTKNIFRKSLVIGIIILFLGASVLPLVNAQQIQNRFNKDKFNEESQNDNLNLPQPSSGAVLVNFNITFYEPSSRFFQGLGADLRIEFLMSIDLSDNYVGKIEYQKPITKTKITYEYKHAMFIFLIAFKDTYDDSHYNNNTKVGYITGTALLIKFNGF